MLNIQTPVTKPPRNLDTIKRSNIRIIGIGMCEETQLKGPANIFYKIIEKNFRNPKRCLSKFKKHKEY